MTIDEAIENLEQDVEIDMYIHDIASQLAEWLEDYKRLKNIPEHNYYNCHNLTCRRKCEKDGYNKAIDDFTEKIIRYVDCSHLCSTTEIRWSDLAVVEMVKKLAEQLKAGDGE